MSCGSSMRFICKRQHVIIAAALCCLIIIVNRLTTSIDYGNQGIMSLSNSRPQQHINPINNNNRIVLSPPIYDDTQYTADDEGEEDQPSRDVSNASRDTVPSDEKEYDMNEELQEFENEYHVLDELPGKVNEVKVTQETAKYIYVTNRLNGFLREISSCNRTLYDEQEVSKNLLCATPQTVMTYPSIERYVIPQVASPCVFVRQSSRERGDHGWNFKITPPSINILDGSKTINLYKVNCLPKAFIAGFPKCGTTDLHVKLSEHQSVQSGLRKEVSWFENGKSYERFYTENGTSTLSLYAYMRIYGEASQNIENDIVSKHTQILEEQLQQAQNGGHNKKRQESRDMRSETLSDSILLDSSPGYYDDAVLHSIAHLLPDSKLIFIMRDPVEREFSKYRFHFQLNNSRKRFNRKNQNAESFHQYVLDRLKASSDPWSTSCYHSYIETALSLFKRDNLLFLQFEEFVEDPVGCLQSKVLPFLALDDFNTSIKRRMMKAEKAGSHKNKSKLTYKMLYKTRVLLRKYFSPYNRKLVDVLEHDKWTWGY